MKKPVFILVSKQNILIYICIIILAILLTSTFLRFKEQRRIAINSFTGMDIRQVPLASNGMEPETPQDLDDPPFYSPPMPSMVVPISEVIKKGSEIPLEFIYNDPDWKRKAYKEYWHSKYRRWSYVPIRLHYAMHQIFTTYRTASVYYDFVHDLGIAEESTQFKSFVPSPIYGTKKVNPYEKMEIVIMKSDVKGILTFGNQVVLIARPERTGLQALLIPMNCLKPFDPDENLLVQLATPEGDEIDYSLISIAKFNVDQALP